MEKNEYWRGRISKWIKLRGEFDGSWGLFNFINYQKENESGSLIQQNSRASVPEQPNNKYLEHKSWKTDHNWGWFTRFISGSQMFAPLCFESRKRHFLQRWTKKVLSVHSLKLEEQVLLDKVFITLKAHRNECHTVTMSCFKYLT